MNANNQITTTIQSETQRAQRASKSSAVVGGSRSQTHQKINTFPNQKRPVRTCRLTKRPILSASSITKLFGIRRHQTNSGFNATFARQVRNSNLRTVEPALVDRIDEQIACVRCQYYGWRQPAAATATVAAPALRSSMDEPPASDGVRELLPPSEWVYETPEKQRIKTMTELNFADEPDGYIPAVLQVTQGANAKHKKTVYVMKELQRPAIDIRAAKSGQIVPIDLKYLRAECTLTTDTKPLLFLDVHAKRDDPLVENIFLENENETSINFNDHKCSVKKKKTKQHLPTLSNETLTWYEKHMKVLATCRPLKAKQDRFAMLRRKSLSFQNETPPNHRLKLRTRFRSFDQTLLSDNVSCSPSGSSTDTMESDFFLQQEQFEKENQVKHEEDERKHVRKIFADCGNRPAAKKPKYTFVKTD